jgi:PST family polysaccharide transporter
MAKKGSNSAIYVLLHQIGGLLIQITQLLVMSRLLDPVDFGLYAMAASTFTMVRIFRDFGFSSSTIQAKNISHQVSTNLFWIGMLVSTAIAGAMVAAAPLVAVFFKEPVIRSLMLWLGLIYVVSSAGNQPTALAQRNFRFKALAAWGIISKLVGLGCGTASAAAGNGVWSLVALTLVTESIDTLSSFVVSGFRPGRMRNVAQAQYHLFFGAWLTLSAVLGFFAQNLDNILIGRIFGAEALGFYNRAFSLLIFPMRSLLSGFTRLNFASFSRLVDKRAQYDEQMKLTLHFYLLVSSMAIVPMAACSHDVVLIAMGAKWSAVAPIFQILAPYAWVQVVINSSNVWLLSCGKVKSLNAIQIWNCLCSVIAITAAIPYGVLGIATSFSITGVFIRLPLFVYYAWKENAVRLKPFLSVLLPNISTSILAFLICLFAHNQLAGWSIVARLIVVSACAWLIILPCSMLTAHGYRFVLLAHDRIALVIRRKPDVIPDRTA